MFEQIQYCECFKSSAEFGAQKATLTSNIKKCEDVRTREDCQSVLTCNTKKNEREHV